MIWLKCLLTVIFSLQLSTYVTSDSNVTEDAQTALNLLNDQIAESSKLILLNVPNIWNSYINETTVNILQQLAYDIGNFSILVNNVTIFANNITNGKECISELNQLLDIQNYHVNVLSSEEQVYRNLILVAAAEVESIIEQHVSLNNKFIENCINTNQSNCNAISQGIVADVERLLPMIKRIPYGLLTEVYVLGYNLQANWELVQSVLMIDYNKVIQNATLCLVHKIQNDIKEFIYEEPSIVKESISEAYLDLIGAVEDSFISSLRSVLYSLTNITTQSEKEYSTTISNIRDVVFRANRTVNSLLGVAEEFNVTTNCSGPNLIHILSTSSLRVLDDYTLDIRTRSNQYEEGIHNLNSSFVEIESIGFEVRGCTGDVNCDYLLDELTRKTVEIPLELRVIANSTSLILHQSVLAVRESGAKIVRDVLDQLQASIIGLKSCIRLSLY